MNDDYIEEEIKTMFKVSKRLQVAFHDVKSLTYKYLLKVKQLKNKRAIALGEIDEKNRLEEMQQKKKEKIQNKKLKDHERKKDKSEGIQPNSKASRSASKLKQQQKKTEKKFDPNVKPQQPLSPYFLFLNDKKKQIKASSPNMSLQQISKIMRSIWDKLTDEQKRPYALEYQKLRIQYDKQMQIYYRNMNSNNENNKATTEQKKSKSRSKSKGGVISERSSQKDAFDYIDELQF